MTSRRAFLAGAGGTFLAALAGCLGGQGGASLPQPVLGDADAPVTVAVYADFGCPSCRRFHERVFPTLLENLVDTGRVRYEHHDFPIPVDPVWSWGGALAARSVQATAGDDAFWAFSDRLYGAQGGLSESLVESFADGVGADAATVLADLRNRTYELQVGRNRRRGEELGVPGTPAVFVDGEAVAPSAAAVLDAVERAEA